MENRRKRALDSRVDYGVILPVFLLTLIGMLSLYVALKNDNTQTHSAIMSSLLQQGLWVLVGILCIFVIIHMSSKILWKLTPYLYIFGLILMILPLYFYNPDTLLATGSKNWVSFGGRSLFQPSELMKIPYILMLALLVTQHNAKFFVHKVTTDLLLIGKMLVATFPVVVLLKFQKDLGTMLVFVAIFGGVLLLSGVSWKILLPLLLVFCLSVAVVIYLVLNETGREILMKLGIAQYQFDRIDSWLHPFQDPSAKSYQQARALIAIGSGGLFGKGFDVVQLQIPVRESDMIFTVIGENFGFAGSALVILLYFVLIYRMIRVTFKSNNQFNTYISTGIIMMILFHVFENIGANIGLLPLTGIPLPFISKGGSSLIGNLIGIGLVLSMRYHTKPDFEEWKEEKMRLREKARK